LTIYQFISDKNEYASVVAGSDKHKYGYELKENRHFHHTTTEEGLLAAWSFNWIWVFIF
jgi:hypothetical protein